MYTIGWFLLLGYVFSLLFFDFFVLNKKIKSHSNFRALKETIFFILNSLFFGIIIYFLYDKKYVENALFLMPKQAFFKYFIGYLVELSLSVDNLFVIALVFIRYKIPKVFQHKLLFLGILGAIIFRAILIFFGIALLNKIHQFTIVFGVFLLYTALKMLFFSKEKQNEKENEKINKKGIIHYFKLSDNITEGQFIVKEKGKRVFTTLFGALLVIEFTDLLFALDSVPAILAITTDPFLVFSSNIFAVMGLRSLYFLLGNMLERFLYLKYSIIAILIFISFKLIFSQFIKIPEWILMSYITLALALGIIISIFNNKNK